MENESVFELLVKSQIIKERPDENVELSERFNETLSQQEEEGAEAIIEELRSEDISSEHVSRLEEIVAFDPEFVTHYGAVNQAIEEEEFETVVRATVLLEQFEAQTLPTEGSPELFFPIRGEKLPTLLSIFPIAVVYIWREESSECATMRRDLNQLFDEPSEDVALFSVYGPDSAAFLEEEYNVIGGPTTLFVANGEVDSRLYGAQFPTVVEREINELLKTAKKRGVL